MSLADGTVWEKENPPRRRGSFKGYKLYLTNGEIVEIGGEEFSDQAGIFSRGDPESVLATMKRKGYFAVDSRDNTPAGLNGGCGDINYLMTNIIKIEVRR
jgi:hypothetical protein